MHMGCKTGMGLGSSVVWGSRWWDQLGPGLMTRSSMANLGPEIHIHTLTQIQVQIDRFIVIVIRDRALKKLTDRFPPSA
jgi:hypothetical protein